MLHSWWAHFKTKKILTALLAACVFLVPTNLFYVLNERLGYAASLRIDYLIPKLYLSLLVVELLLVTQSTVWLATQPLPYLRTIKSTKRLLKSYKWYLFVPIILILITFYPYNFDFSILWNATQALLIVLWATFLSKSGMLWRRKAILRTLLLTQIFQASVGLYQFVFQKSVFGYFLFGEVDMQRGFGLATQHFSLFGEKVLAYGTTPHPNIFAGICVLLLALALVHPKRTRTTTNISLACATAACILASSVSASISLLFVVLYKVSSKRNKIQLCNLVAFISILLPVYIPIAAHFTTHPSIQNRALLQSFALTQINEKPLLGAGIGQFSKEVALSKTAATNFAQPVHNVFLLILSETGLVGLGVCLYVLYKIKMNAVSQQKMLLFALLPIAALDHYLVSIIPGMLATALTLGVALQKKSLKKLSPRLNLYPHQRPI